MMPEEKMLETLERILAAYENKTGEFDGYGVEEIVGMAVSVTPLARQLAEVVRAARDEDEPGGKTRLDHSLASLDAQVVT
jgi:hypothetical protein